MQRLPWIGQQVRREKEQKYQHVVNRKKGTNDPIWKVLEIQMIQETQTVVRC